MQANQPAPAAIGTRRRPALLSLSALLLALVFAGCCSEGTAPYPFEDGDTLEYRGFFPETGVTSHLRYVVEKKGAGFIVRRYHAVESKVGGRTEETNLASAENVCDRYGRVKQRADGRSAGSCKGNYCFLWLPPSLRHKGATLKLSEDARDAEVIRELRRDGLDVLLVTVGSEKFYYDKSSGYLVERGRFGKLVRSSRGPI